MGELLKTGEREKGYNCKKLRGRERGLGACRRQQGRKRGMAAVLFRSRKGGHSPRMSSVHFLSQVKPFAFVESPSWMLFAPLLLSPERRKGEFASSSSSHDKGPLSLSVPAWLAWGPPPPFSSDQFLTTGKERDGKGDCLFSFLSSLCVLICLKASDSGGGEEKKEGQKETFSQTDLVFCCFLGGERQTFFSSSFRSVSH